MKQSTPTALKKPEPLKILLMGPPGSRKTTLCMTFPNVHFMDCDGNLDGPEVHVRKTNSNLSYTFDSIGYDDSSPPKIVNIEDRYERLCDKLKLVKSSPEYSNVKFVVIDSCSQLNEFVIRYTLKQQGKTRHTLEMEARDWNPFKSFTMALFVVRLEETNRHSICTFHEEYLYDPGDGKDFMTKKLREVNPYYQGSIGDNMAYMFTDCWKVEIRQGPGGTRPAFLLTQPTPLCKCLKNSCNMPPEIELKDGFKTLEPYLKGRM